MLVLINIVCNFLSVCHLPFNFVYSVFLIDLNSLEPINFSPVISSFAFMLRPFKIKRSIVPYILLANSLLASCRIAQLYAVLNVKFYIQL